jgi:hypothetical protein
VLLAGLHAVASAARHLKHCVSLPREERDERRAQVVGPGIVDTDRTRGGLVDVLAPVVPVVLDPRLLWVVALREPNRGF